MSIYSSRGHGPKPGNRRFTTPMNEINVTPMVDVMLVLLVIFMVTAPLLTSGVAVDLPETNSEPIAGSDEPLVVSIDAAGQVFVQETIVDVGDLPAQLAAASGANPGLRIFVRGDKTIAYGRVMAVVGAIHAAGFRQVALVTEPLETPGVRGGKDAS